MIYISMLFEQKIWYFTISLDLKLTYRYLNSFEFHNIAISR